MNIKPVSAAVALAVSSLIGPAAYAASIDLTPISQAVNVGDTFFVDFVGKGFASPLDGGGFNLAFDPSVVRLDSVVIDTTKWEFLPSGGLIDNTSGTATDISFNTFVNSNVGDFNIGRFNFTALAIGTSPFTMTDSAAFPFGSGGVPVNVTYNAGQAQVVPVPAAFWFLLSGAMGLLGFRKGGSRHVHA